MKKHLDDMMATGALGRGSASDPSARQKLREFFIYWAGRGFHLSVADWEHYLKDRKWSMAERREVLHLPEDVSQTLKHFGHTT